MFIKSFEITANDVNKHYHHSHEFVAYFEVILSWKAKCQTSVAYMIAMVTTTKQVKKKYFVCQEIQPKEKDGLR